MKKFLSPLLYVVCVLAAFITFGMASAASAQQIIVGTGSAGNTYNRQFNEIRKECSKELAMVEWTGKDNKPSNGAVRNAELLTGNEINGAFMQADILYMMAKTQDLSDIKTLLVLNSEVLHYIVKSDLVVKKGGYLGMGGTSTPVTSLDQISGMTVAASGGGAWSAKQVRLDSEIPYNIMEVADSKAAIAALDKTASVALIVGGFPVDYIKTLGKGYRILTMSDTVRSKIKGAYLPAQTAYNNMADGGVAQTAAVQSLFVVREYKSPKMVAALSALRSCVLNNLDDLKETTGNHPSWRQVKLENQSQAKWPLYQFPGSKK